MNFSEAKNSAMEQVLQWNANCKNESNNQYNRLVGETSVFLSARANGIIAETNQAVLSDDIKDYLTSLQNLAGELKTYTLEELRAVHIYWRNQINLEMNRVYLEARETYVNTLKLIPETMVREVFEIPDASLAFNYPFKLDSNKLDRILVSLIYARNTFRRVQEEIAGTLESIDNDTERLNSSLGLYLSAVALKSFVQVE